jgi:hypothetical protein
MPAMGRSFMRAFFGGGCQRLARDADEEILEGGGPVFARQRLGIALEQHFAAREEQHAIADRCYFVHVVRGPEDAAAIDRWRGF